jgi:hypothetical protein
MLRAGHWRLGKSMAGKARYLVAGLVNTVKIPQKAMTDSEGYLRLGGGVDDCVFAYKFTFKDRLLPIIYFFSNFNKSADIEQIFVCA